MLAQEKARKPDWLKRTVPGGDKYVDIKAKLRELKLNTVCEEVSSAAVIVDRRVRNEQQSTPAGILANGSCAAVHGVLSQV